MRRNFLKGAVATFALLCSVPTFAQDITGEIKILTWFGGGELDALHQLEEAFVAQYPGVTFNEVIPTAAGHPAGGLRTVLLGGEPIDIIINTWPWFRKELADNGLIRPIDELWDARNFGQYLNDSWKALGQTDGVTYGVQYNFGNRSGWFYRNDVLEKAGVTPPVTWDDFLASIPKFKQAGIIPMSLAAKDIGHSEIFATLLIRVGGVELARQLAAHEVAWTDPKVREALVKFKEMFDAGAFPDSATALGTAWDNAADTTLKQGTTAYLQMFGYAAVHAEANFGVKPGTDFNITQFPTMGLGFDDTSVVEAKEFLAGATGSNPDAADAFLEFALSPEASDIYAAAGFGVPSSATDTSLYGTVVKQASDVLSEDQLTFVLADTLPGELSDELNVQLQKFVQTPDDATIDSVLAAIEAKATELY
jgi:multiple sugar transport system substrate-binding protein